MNAVGQKHDNHWQTRINLDNDLNWFRETHISVSMASVWKFLTNCSDLLPAKFVAKLIPSVPNNNVPSCGIWKRVCKYVFIHMSLTCHCISEICSICWDLMCKIHCRTLCWIKRMRWLKLIGKDSLTDLCASDLDAFKRLCYTQLVASAAEYKMLHTETVHT